MLIGLRIMISEAWTLTARDISRIQAAEMRFLRAVKG
jgi:hypothetical protein